MQVGYGSNTSRLRNPGFHFVLGIDIFDFFFFQ
jgi:hypothetical protein